MKTPNVVIRTRLTHVMMMPAFLLPVLWIAFMNVFPWTLFTIAFVVSSAMISVALLLIAREFMSESEGARVENDKIVFNSRSLFGFRLERDIRLYMELRLRYPQDAFSKDPEITALLRQSHVQGLQRLFDISDRLSQTATLSF